MSTTAMTLFLAETRDCGYNYLYILLSDPTLRSSDALLSCRAARILQKIRLFCERFDFVSLAHNLRVP